MAKITLKGNPCNTVGELPVIGSEAPSFNLKKTDLSFGSLDDFKGKKLLLNIFPSIDTGVCAASTRRFNEEASSLDNAHVICVSKDLPFAQGRFCGAEGIDNVTMMSDFLTGEFGKAYEVDILDGPLQGLHSRSVVVLDENHKVVYVEQVPEITQEPNYSAAIDALG